jgi:hypothetical protein
MSNLQNKAENISTIMVCIDTTNASQAALTYACYKAKARGFKVHILAVLEASHKNLLFGSKAMGDEKRQQLEKHLDKLISNVQEKTGILPSVSIREGEISTEIVREFKLVSGCKLIVFGKSNNALSDNTVLPQIVGKIGSKINTPITIIPESLSGDPIDFI